MKPSDKEPSKCRLQVYLSRNGVCSRRKAMELIQKGVVSVDGKVIREPSFPVDHSRRIAVNKKEVQEKRYDYIMLNKPSGCVTTKKDRFAKKTVFDYLPKHYQHLIPVGRLDKDTEGLLLFTNDGDLTYRLTHPKFNIDKTYFVKINGNLSAHDKRKLQSGVVVESKKTAPAKIHHLKFFKSHCELNLIIHEGRKRQIRLMFENLGHRVIYLKRVAQGPLNLGQLKKGSFRGLTREEVSKLKNIH